jgi:hypothetical protein
MYFLESENLTYDLTNGSALDLDLPTFVYMFYLFIFAWLEYGGHSFVYLYHIVQWEKRRF